MGRRQTRISSTDLVRSIGRILRKVRFQGESFVIERNGREVAVLMPLQARPRRSLKQVLSTWMASGPPDLDFAAALEQVGREDRPLEDPGRSSSTRAP